VLGWTARWRSRLERPLRRHVVAPVQRLSDGRGVEPVPNAARLRARAPVLGHRRALPGVGSRHARRRSRERLRNPSCRSDGSVLGRGADLADRHALACLCLAPRGTLEQPAPLWMDPAASRRPHIARELNIALLQAVDNKREKAVHLFLWAAADPRAPVPMLKWTDRRGGRRPLHRYRTRNVLRPRRAPPYPET